MLGCIAYLSSYNSPNGVLTVLDNNDLAILVDHVELDVWCLATTDPTCHGRPSTGPSTLPSFTPSGSICSVE